MRILLAVDGSVSSDRATQLVSSFPLPPARSCGSSPSSRPSPTSSTMSLAIDGRPTACIVETEQGADARYRREAISTARRSRSTVPTCASSAFLLRGRPGAAIVDEATSLQRRPRRPRVARPWRRSRRWSSGPPRPRSWTTRRARSSSRAPARSGRSRSPTTGRRAPRSAEALFSTWPIFAGRHVDVLTVAETSVPVAVGFVSGLHDQVVSSYGLPSTRPARRSPTSRQTPAQRLQRVRAGRRAGRARGRAGGRDRAVRRGARHGHDRRGHARPHRPDRLVLGSVARNVLLHAPCSVLVVRPAR